MGGSFLCSVAAKAAVPMVCLLANVLSAGGVRAGQEPGSQTANSQRPKVVITVGVPDKIMNPSAITKKPAAFADLPGWDRDDHLSAWKAFVTSCPAVIERSNAGKGNKSPASGPAGALADVCQFALSLAASGRRMTGAGAKGFFEANFRPKAIVQEVKPGLLTGYYEPMIKASRTPDDTYRTPVYRRPGDLVNVVAESERGAKSEKFTHLRQTGEGLKPYLTRAEIEQGALKGQGLELLYFRDPVDVYFLQVQGSGRIELPDGEKIRITYDGKNGYPYTSIGRELIEAGTFTPDNMSLKALANWLKADRKRAEPVMWKNQSYVFFRELKGAQADGAMGALATGLHTGRSLAIDTAYHALGTPIYVAAPEITHASDKGEGFNRLMIAHDVGSAIKGPERGDIYFGSGDKAGKIAGVTKHPGHFFVLEPAPVLEAGSARAPGKTP